ncbi:hypothetical protein [Streptomyces sp. NPDC058495]|uniref:hypothetical protein n=1 Tax=unclassified Streptomyces TaxID=2593676 RepID=UPI003652CA30
MSTTSPGPYDWASDAQGGLSAVPSQPQPQPQVVPPMSAQPPQSQPQAAPSGRSRTTRAASAVGAAAGGFAGAAASGFIPPINVNIGGGNGNGGGNGGGRAPAPGAGDRHQGDRMIHLVERIELRSDKDIVNLCRAINRLGRELHLILGMRAEEVQGVLSTYKGKWYHFGASNRVRARLVAAHLRVGAEAARALGVAALKTAHAFDRHFVAPEREAKQRARGETPKKKSFTIGEE